MKVASKVFGCLMGVCAVASVALAAEEPKADQPTSKSRAVLFKVHDITPVLNSDGLVTDCDFLVTFYNRSPDGLRSAKLDLGWTDTVSDKFLIEGEEENEELPKRPQSYNRIEKDELGNIRTTVDMPSLGAYAQTTVKGVVKTEKCFALMENLKFNVTACSVADSNTRDNSRASRSRPSSECVGLFQFVSPSNPEYYDEFKEVSYSEQEEMLNTEKATNLEEINTKYNDIVSTFEKANTVLSNIQ